MNIIDNSNISSFLKPIQWCGEQWRALSHFEASSTVEKVAKSFIRVLPGLLLLSVTLFAAGIATIDCIFRRSPVDSSYAIPVPEHLKQHLLDCGILKEKNVDITYKLLAKIPYEATSLGCYSQNLQFIVDFQMSPNLRTMNPFFRVSEVFKGSHPLPIQQTALIDSLFGIQENRDLYEAFEKELLPLIDKVVLVIDRTLDRMVLKISSHYPNKICILY